jgi:hypothetical protein
MYDEISNRIKKSSAPFLKKEKKFPIAGQYLY